MRSGFGQNWVCRGSDFRLVPADDGLNVSAQIREVAQMPVRLVREVHCAPAQIEEIRKLETVELEFPLIDDAMNAQQEWTAKPEKSEGEGETKTIQVPTTAQQRESLIRLIARPSAQQHN